MKTLKYKIIAFIFIAFNLNAQTGDNSDLGSEDIIVVNEYEARIADAQKLNINPETQEVEVEKQELDYDVPEKLLELNYPAHQVKPLAMPKLKPIKYQSSYVKLGLGVNIGEKVYISPLAEVVYNNYKVKNLVFGAHYKHHSSLAKGQLNQKFRNEDARLYFKYFINKVEMGLNANFTQNEDFFYGYPTDSVRISKNIRQTVNNFGTNLYFKNAGINKIELDYLQKVGFNYMFDAYKNKEWYVDYDGLIVKTFKNTHYLDVILKAYLSNYIPTDRGDIEREIFQFGAAYTFNDDNWKLKAGIVFAFGEVAFDEKVNFYPIIYTEKKLYKNHLIFYSSWSRNIKINTYKNFLAENPYINLAPKLKNSRVEDRIAGFKGSYKKFTYNARFSNKVITDMPLYVNDTTDMSRFDIVYEKNLKVYDINVEASMKWTKDFDTRLSFDYNFYEPTFEEKAWHLPALNASLNATYKIQNKYFINLELYGLANAWAKNENGDAVKIPGTGDLNLGFEYKHSKYFSIFVNLNNIAHSQQTQYYNYNNYGFNGIVGAKFIY